MFVLIHVPDILAHFRDRLSLVTFIILSMCFGGDDILAHVQKKWIKDI